MNNSNNKRIAKNTAMLYFRMILVLGVSLYTVRIILQTLGVQDYGIYNVVGGIVAMFSFLSNSMATATQRFLTFEIGRKNYIQLKKVFSASLTIYACIAVVIILFAETVGIWFLNSRLTIPADRLEAANWTFQFSVLSFTMTILSIPYNAAIIAHEKMNVYAYVGIVEVILKLMIVSLLNLFTYDHLKLYALLTFLTTTLIRYIYRTYCRRHFPESKFEFSWNKEMFKDIFSFSGWNLLGSLAIIFKTQGNNLLLNIFFNPIVNAAWGIAYQINTALTNFTNNFFTAVRPQITKSYASGDHGTAKNLVFQSAKLSYYLTMFLSIPILLETHFILEIWLKKVPENVVLFSQLVVTNSLLEVINLPLVASIQATGKIRLYQSVISIIMLLNVPISYVFLFYRAKPSIALYISIGITLICFIPRLWIAQKTASIPAKEFFSKVLIILPIVTLGALIPPAFLIGNMPEGFTRFFVICIVSACSCLLSIYTIGLRKEERKTILEFIVKRKRSKTHKLVENENS